jgi:hypothetical protein
MDNPATVAALIDMAATGARRLTPGEVSRVLAHVAAAGFDPDARERAGGRLAGIAWRGRTVRGSNLLNPAEVHYLRHVVAGQEWPTDTTLEAFLDSARRVILDPISGIAASRYQGALQLTAIRRTGRWRGPKGFAWILVDYRVAMGHWTTVFQPKDEFKALREAKREDIRWLRRPKSRGE